MRRSTAPHSATAPACAAGRVCGVRPTGAHPLPAREPQLAWERPCGRTTTECASALLRVAPLRSEGAGEISEPASSEGAWLARLLPAA